MPKGVIHVGAHKGEEIGIYDELGIEDVIWVEANPKIFEVLKENIVKFKKQKAFNFLVSDVDDKEYVFYVTNNGESSSILELDKHKIHHPHIHVTETMNLTSKKLDSILTIADVNIKQFDFLNLDVQGAELLVLKGFSEGLKDIKYIYTEINTGEVYKNCAKVDELDEFLAQYNFERKETHLTEYEWGDALYIKKKDEKNNISRP